MSPFYIIFFLSISISPFLPEASTQGISFDVYPEKRWPNRIIPFSINPLDFSVGELANITLAIANIALGNCLVMTPRILEDDYVHIFSGNGCWSHLGRIGGQQPLSLGAGCTSRGTIQHQFLHAAGFAHEHNRLDRDDFVEVLWDNIPDEWKNQYEKTNSSEFGLQASYDYYSVMHYPLQAPGTDKPAFVLKENVNASLVGSGVSFNQSTLAKINLLYGCS